MSEYMIIVLTTIFINIILAVSLNMINGMTGQFSLGHAGFMAVGAYTSAIIVKEFHFSIAAGLAAARCRRRRSCGRRRARTGARR